jgi:hypothetical protein
MVVRGRLLVCCVTCRLRLSAETPGWDTSSVDWVETESANGDVPDKVLQDKESDDATAGQARCKQAR